MAENKKKVEEEKKAISKTDGQTVIRTAAGWAVAATEYLDVATTGASQIADTINQLDAALTQLANLDLDGSCKKKTFEFSPGSEGDGTVTGEDFVESAKGCNPFRNLPAFKKLEAGEEVEGSDVAATIIGIVEKLTGPSSFPDCVFQQYRNFLSAFPVEYYLLLGIKEVAEGLKDPIESLNSVPVCKANGAVGKLGDELNKFELGIPEITIPTIPELPYIPIPDLLDILINIILETICFALCTALTPLIETIGENLFESISDVKESVGEDKNQPLIKTSIEPFLTPDILAEIKSFVDKNIKKSKKITPQVIKDYIVSVQNSSKISQDEFILLLLGKTNCNVYDTIVGDIPETVSLFELDTENKLLSFFAFVGSTINTLLFIQDSRAKVCDPDPCELKDGELIDKVSNLCRLLNPDTNVAGLIPTNEILEKTGALDFIAKALKTSYDSIANSATTYNPIYNPVEESTLNQSYIEKFSGFLLNFNEIMITSYNTAAGSLNQTQLTEGQRDAVRNSVISLRKDYYQELFAFADVLMSEESSSNEQVAGSNDFIKNGVTVRGVAPDSKFQFRVFAKFNEQQIKDKLALTAKKIESNPAQIEKDMAEFAELKFKYGIV